MPKKKVEKVTNSPKAPFKFTRHILAPFSGIFIFFMVLGLLNFQWIQAQAQYRFAKPVDTSSITISTTSPSNITVPTISIPKLRASAPIVFVANTENWAIEKGLQNGVVHFGGSVNPGQRGNIVIFGHSSGLPWSEGRYKFIFTLLDKLETDDKIIIDSAGTRYIYSVVGSKVVKPEDTSVLNQTKENLLTLITCTPVGTNSKRLIVTAKQISPVPTPPSATEAVTPVAEHPVTSVSLPSNSPSFWQTIKDLF